MELLNYHNTQKLTIQTMNNLTNYQQNSSLTSLNTNIFNINKDIKANIKECTVNSISDTQKYISLH